MFIFRKGNLIRSIGNLHYATCNRRKPAITKQMQPALDRGRRGEGRPAQDKRNTCFLFEKEQCRDDGKCTQNTTTNEIINVE